MENNNPWVQATEQALGLKQQALHQVVGQVAGRVPDQEQAAQYLHFRQNPQALLQWSAETNGPDRAVPEAQKYMRTMEKRYGNLSSPD